MHSVKPITAVIDACRLSNFSIQKQPCAMCMLHLFFNVSKYQIGQPLAANQKIFHQPEALFGFKLFSYSARKATKKLV